MRSVVFAAVNFQDMIGTLNAYWSERGAVIMQPYHTELGAGTSNPATFLRVLDPSQTEWRAAYVEPVIRPTDGRYGENPFRFQHYFQYQVILKPAPEDVLDQYFGSLEALGIDLRKHDIRLVEDDWEQATLGAWGLGWEVWCDGMEVTQFTYFQQLGGIDLEVDPRRDDLRARAARALPPGQAVRLRARVGSGRHLGRRLPGERAPVVALQLRGGAGRHPPAALRRARGRGRRAAREGACRCRPTTRC